MILASIVANNTKYMQNKFIEEKLKEFDKHIQPMTSVEDGMEWLYTSPQSIKEFLCSALIQTYEKGKNDTMDSILCWKRH